RTGCSTRRGKLVRLERSLLGPRAILGFADALDTESTLLHHALPAHRDIRIELPVEGFRKRVLRSGGLSVSEPVEVPDFIWAIVGAIACADAPIVHLDVETVRRVIGGVYGTDRLARRITTVLAQHGNESGVE